MEKLQTSDRAGVFKKSSFESLKRLSSTLNTAAYIHERKAYTK